MEESDAEIKKIIADVEAENRDRPVAHMSKDRPRTRTLAECLRINIEHTE